MTRIARIAFTALTAVAVMAAPASAQDPAQQAYKSKREQLTKELEEVQNQLAETRSQRLQLQTRIEAVIAQMMRDRANALLLSNETSALQQLDAILTSSQDNLLAQRDRFASISDAVRRRTGSVLVVLLRADSSQAQTLGGATLTVNGAQVDTRAYTAAASNALNVGAVDQLYRANVLPTGHQVSVSVTLNGQPVTSDITVTAAPETVTYVQFAVRNGQVTATTWASRGTTPF
jgi:septal ring factor EnvC (AmiA/AmiB activator)